MATNQVVWIVSMACMNNKFTFKYPAYDEQDPKFWSETSTKPPIYSHIGNLVNANAANYVIKRGLAVPYDNFWEHGITKVRYTQN